MKKLQLHGSKKQHSMPFPLNSFLRIETSRKTTSCMHAYRIGREGPEPLERGMQLDITPLQSSSTIQTCVLLCYTALHGHCLLQVFRVCTTSNNLGAFPNVDGRDQ